MNCKAHGCTNHILHSGLCQLHYRRRTRAKPKAQRKKDWSETEKAIVRSDYARLGPTKLAEFLPGRTPQAIRIQAGVLDVRTRTRRPRLVLAEAADVMRKWAGPVNRSRALSPAIGRAA